MKHIRIALWTVLAAWLLSSCGLFKPKYGCPSDGKNVGAEKLMDGSKVKKAKKFKS
ncbi:hypothetical protein V9K67_19805 [Paraflavisolibacter sp. H34]|uniref:hypothetical protein n=1 Tax=Huijunlia imazamoxiresistens TaxID=3127457 RepID=UPI003017F7C8